MKRAFMFFGITAVLIMFAINVLAAPVTLKFAAINPAQSPAGKLEKQWSEKVMKDSEGTLKIDIYAGGTLGRNPTVYLKKVIDGTADIAWAIPDYTPGKFPDDVVFHLPFLAENQFEASLAAQRMLDKGFLQGYEDLVVMNLGTTQPYFIQTKFPVNSPGDLKGHKFRVADKTQADMMKQLGVTPVTGIPITKAAEALSMGVVDGTICDTTGLFAFRIADATSYHVKLPLGTVTIVYAMNKKVYEGLPAKAKQAIDKNRGSVFCKVFYQPLTEVNQKLFDKLQNDPKHTVTIPAGKEREEWKTALQPVIDAWIKETPNGAKLYQAYKNELELIRAGK